jgi:Calcineurin-like phosphoesterase
MRILAQGAVLAGLAVATGSCQSTAQSAGASAPRAAEVRCYPRAEKLTREDQVAVIGDVQRTSVWGRLVFAESNLAEQKSLLEDLATQQFRALVLLGDMVFSAKDDNWNYFDRLMAPLRRAGEACGERSSEPGVRGFFPVMGNHDYMGNQQQVTRQLSQRFKGLLEHTHYSFEWHHVKMIVLDGNRRKLCASPGTGTRACEAEWQAQLAWLRAELHQIDQAPAGEQYGALLFVHQSPYTQSPLVAGDQADARDFAKELFYSNRGLALISAHAHGFERYVFRRDVADLRPAKAFIVSAGGGGPRPHSRRTGAHADLSKLAWPRPFNYLLLWQDAQAVHVDVRGLEKGDHVVIPLSNEKMTLAFR